MNQQISLQKETATTQAFEQRMVQIKKDIVRYREVEKRPELTEFLDLKKVVETEDFQKNKQYLLTRKYSETEEYQTQRKFNKANRSFAVRRYKSIGQREDIQALLQFEQTEDFALLNDKNAVKADVKLQSYSKTNRSFGMKIYRWCAAKPAVADYLALEPVVSSEDFIQRNTFWANPKRWYTTEESKQDNRYLELKANADIQFFLSQDAKQIAEWESYQTLFFDEFEGVNLNKEKWAAGFYYTNKNLKTNHSYINEQQAYNNGKNSMVANSILTVECKKEEAKALAWHPVKGFIEQAYHWTSDNLQTGNQFSAAEGLFMAKARVSGKSTASIYLATGNKLPLIELMRWNGKELSVGIRSEKEIHCTTITGVKAGNWFIYAAKVCEKEITLYINGQEIMRAANPAAGAAFYPSLTEFIPQESQAAAGKLELDWVRVYSK